MFDENVRQAKLDRARKLVRELAEDPNIESAYLCGSLTAGLGNSTSDVDIYVVLHDGSRPDRPEQLDAEGQRVDVEVRSTSDLYDLAKGFVEAHATLADNGALFRLDERFDDATRLMSSEVLKAGPSVEFAKSTLLEHVDRVRQVMIAFRQIRCHGSIEDVHGFLEDGLLDGAMIISATMLFDALEVFLFGCGDLYIGHKWIWQKLARSAGPGFPLVEATRLAFHAPREGTDQEVFVWQRIQFAQACLTAAVLDGWESANAASWPHWGTATKGIHRARDWVTARLDDGIFLDTFRGRRFKMQPDWLRLWGSCDGTRDLEDVVLDHINHQGLDASDPEAQRSVHQQIKQMSEAGIVVLPA